MKIKTSIIIIVLLIFGVSQYSSEAADPKVKVGIGLTTAAVLPVYVLMHKQFYLEEKLDVSFPFFRSGTQTIQALIPGDVHIGVSSINEVVYSHDSGQNVKIFWCISKGMSYQFYAKSTIKTMADLRGKKIGISRYGAMSDFVVRYVVRQYGMDPERDVSILQVGDINTRFAAMKSGAIDATILDPPLTSMASREGFNMLEDVTKFLPDWPYEVMYAKGDYLKENSEIVKKFLKSYKKAIEFSKKDQEGAIQALLKIVPYNKSDALDAYNYFIKSFPDDGSIALGGLKMSIEEDFKEKRIKAQYPPEAVVDNSFIEFFKK